MKKILVYGAGAYAKVFYHEVKRTKMMEIVSFIVDKEFLGSEGNLFGVPVISWDECIEKYPCEDWDMLVLCGYSKMRMRKVMFDKAKEKGYQLINYISPDAYVEDNVIMGENNIIFSNAYVGYGGIMGDGNIVSQNAYLGHSFKMGNHNIIAAGVTIGGNLIMGDLSFIALGVTIVDSGRLGTECLIGAGGVVVKPIQDYGKYYGNPARLISRHDETGVVISEKKEK